MRVFVSGATGVIGRRVVPLLLSQGHSVTVVARHGGRGLHGQANIKRAIVDLFDPAGLKTAVAGHDVVINLATHMPSQAWKMVFRRAWRLNDRIRAEGVANLVAAARSNGVARFVQESFALTYPDHGDRWVDEQAPIDPPAYCRTVLDAEKSVADFSAHGRSGVALRFAAFYGADAMQVKSYIDGLRKGWAAVPGGPDRFISSVSHDDAAAAVVAALDAPAGVYNVVDDEPVTRAVFFGSLAGNLGLKPPRFLPSWVTPLFGSVGDALARSLRLSNRKLKQQTRWSPQYRSVREGWPATLQPMNQA